MPGEHFGPNFPLFRRLVKFVRNYAFLTWFLREKMQTLSPKEAVMTH